MSFRGTGAMVIAACMLAALASGSSQADEKPNAVERGAKKAARGVERTADRTGKWAERTGRRAGKAAERTVDKTETWIRKKTE